MKPKLVLKISHNFSFTFLTPVYYKRKGFLNKRGLNFLSINLVFIYSGIFGEFHPLQRRSFKKTSMTRKVKETKENLAAVESENTPGEIPEFNQMNVGEFLELKEPKITNGKQQSASTLLLPTQTQTQVLIQEKPKIHPIQKSNCKEALFLYFCLFQFIFPSAVSAS